MQTGFVESTSITKISRDRLHRWYYWNFSKK
jgi:hypothetical protein